MGRARGFDVGRPDACVHVALAVPDVHASPQLFLDVGAEPHVRAEQDLGVRAVPVGDVAYDVDGIGRCAAVVRQRLDLSGRIDVHDDDAVRILLPPSRQLLGVDRRRERAPGVQVGDEDGLARAQDRGRLGHEMDTAEDDRLPLGRSSHARETERVPDVVGDVLDLRHLVVVGEDDRVPLSREYLDLELELRDLLRGERSGSARGGRHRQVHHAPPVDEARPAPP